MADIGDWLSNIWNGSDPNGDTGPTATPQGGLSQALGGILKGIISPNGQTALGKGLGGVAQADAQNRGAKLAGMIAGDRMKLDEQAQRAADESGLMRKVQQADYLANGGYTPKQNFSSTGKAIPHFDLGMAPISDTSKQMGKTLEGQMMDRVNKPPTYNDYSSVLNPGTSENILNWLSPILTASGIGRMPPNQGALPTGPQPTQQAQATPSGLQMPGQPVNPLAIPGNGQ